MRYVVFAAALLVAGCATQPVVPGPVASGGPLSVRLLQEDNDELTYVLTEPAYLTLFQVGPDGRALLVHPYYREKPAISKAGLHALRPRGSAPALFYAARRGRTGVSAPRPTYLYLIASKAPLQLEAIEQSLRRQPRTFSENDDISEILTRVETLAVGAMSDSDWASDLSVIWPEGRLARPVTR